MLNLYKNDLLTQLYSKFILRNPRLRQMLAKLIVPDKEIDIQLFGASLRINMREELGYWNAYKQSRAAVVLRDEAPVILSLALILGPTDTFVDVGANVGLYSACLAKLQSIYPKMQFYAFEPHPQTVKRLQDTLTHRNVHILPYALSDRPGQLQFAQGFSSAVFGVKRDTHQPYQIPHLTETIETKSLDSMGIVGDSIVLKVDVEGMERQVIEGGAELFARGRIKAVYLDGYEDKTLRDYFLANDFVLFEGRTLQPDSGNNTGYSLLALNKKYLQR